MITGYNHNVIHCNQVFHIQTEDSGTKYPHIITHLFVGGNIISSKKCSYAHLMEQNLDEMGLEKAVRGMMQEQHKDMLRDLKAGLFDHFASSSDSNEVWDGEDKSSPVTTEESEASTPILPAVPSPSQVIPPTRVPVPTPQPERSSERSSPENRAAAVRGSARMSRRRPPKERPVLASGADGSNTQPGTQPTSVITALRSIEIGSNDNWDMLFEDNTPTVQELPDAGMLWESSQAHELPPIAQGATVRTIVTPNNKEPGH